MKRGSSVVERWTRNRVNPGSNPPLVPFRRLGIFVLSIDAPVDCLSEYLAIDSGGNASDLVFSHNCSIARMLPGEAENGVGMNRSARGGKIVKCFERILRYIKTTFTFFSISFRHQLHFSGKHSTMLQILREQYSFLLFPPLSVAR